MRRLLAIFSLSVLMGALTLAPAFASGSSSSTVNGLTCTSSWNNTWGGVNCSGDSVQGWRLHVACSFQPDFVGAWHYGPGSDGFECNFGVDNASVEWLGG